jgi:ABC-type polysaccharide/polyol phosphate transport system ATPase subunit
VRSGECLGIVGSNGSGKSTILQILAGITLPTRGVVHIRGKVLPLLAVGSGFHPDLTGRENIVLYGTILGAPRDVILGRVDEIAAFAEIERHLDTPTKRYSDGMQARLSFAIAMGFPADIYIFDEVLAVVDGEFRLRCLGEIERCSRSGRTVLLVSHDMAQIRTLADRVMWMEHGRVRRLGPAADVLDEYERTRDEYRA